LQVAGQLDRVRRLTVTAGDWRSVVQVERPEAIW
jgi:hypothetical protein